MVGGFVIEAPPDPAHGRRRLGAMALGLLGAALLVAASVLPVAFTNDRGRTIITWLAWTDVETLAIAALVGVGVAVVAAGRIRSAAGIFIAAGICSATIWIRDLGIPASEWLDGDGRTLPSPAGFVGLIGSAVVLATGWWLTSMANAASDKAESRQPAVSYPAGLGSE